MFTLYTETAVQVVPPTKTSSINFAIPRRDGSYDKIKSPGKKRPLETNHTEDEQVYSQHYLASQSSIYFRQTKRYPRTFLWRVIKYGKTLQLRCADLVRSENDTREAYLTLNFDFQDTILPGGVAFADFDNPDELHVFVCTSRNELFNLRLPTDAFRSLDALVDDLNEWCRPVDSSALSIDTVYRVHASSPLEVFVAFTSGRVLRVTRRSNDENWAQENYDDRTWAASIRGIVGRRGPGMIEYGDTQLDARTAQSMLVSPDTNYLFTVCLNHQIRVWHLPTGKLVVNKDLLDETRDVNSRVQLNPSESGLLQILRLPLYRYPVLITYSPYQGGQFKFWDVKGGLTEPLSLEDKFPGMKLSPPDPDPTGNTIWSLTNFATYCGDDFSKTNIWALWRNNNHHQLYSLTFDIADPLSGWDSNWVRCDSSWAPKISPPDMIRSDSEDPTTKWLEYLFFPGRYPEPVLETALSIYQNAILSKSTSQSHVPLQQRLCDVVAANVSLRKYEEANMDYERFVVDTDYQWRSFWRILENLNEGRHAPLSLAHDAFVDMPWVVMADKCCAVREDNELELVLLNADNGKSENVEDIVSLHMPERRMPPDSNSSFDSICQLVHAARNFRKSFPAELGHEFYSSIESLLQHNLEQPDSHQVGSIYEHLGFETTVTGEMFDHLEKDLIGLSGLESLDTQIFLEILDVATGDNRLEKPKSALRSTVFGQRILSAGILERLVVSKELLLDLLALIVFVEGEVNVEQQGPLQAAEVFYQILPLLQDAERNLWLATHFRKVLLDFPGVEAKSQRQGSVEGSSNDMQTVCILEDTLSNAVRPQPTATKSLRHLMTGMLDEIEEWISGRNTIRSEEAAVYLQCDLLAHDDIELATEFNRFQPTTPWSTYIKGRLCLCKGDLRHAATSFRKAAYSLACGKALGDLKELSAGLLTTLELHGFNNGLPRYYQHVLQLFESKKAFVQAGQFAQLALQALMPGQKEPTHGFRSEILSRLFSAQLQTSQFEAAYSTLIQFSDHSLQKSCAVHLVETILNSTSTFMSRSDAIRLVQSFPGSLHPSIARHIDKYLTSKANRQTFVSLSGNKAPNFAANDYSTNSKTDYVRIIYALRISQNDFSGALTILYDHLRRVQRSAKARKDAQSTALREALLSLINVMTCMDPEDAYILTEVDNDTTAQNNHVDDHQNGADVDTDNDPSKTAQPKKKRKLIITIDDLRREYQDVLDRCNRIERGDFEFGTVDSDEDDEEDQEDEQMEGVTRLGLDKFEAMNRFGKGDGDHGGGSWMRNGQGRGQDQALDRNENDDGMDVDD